MPSSRKLIRSVPFQWYSGRLQRLAIVAVPGGGHLAAVEHVLEGRVELRDHQAKVGVHAHRRHQQQAHEADAGRMPRPGGAAAMLARRGCIGRIVGWEDDAGSPNPAWAMANRRHSSSAASSSRTATRNEMRAPGSAADRRRAGSPGRRRPAAAGPARRTSRQAFAGRRTPGRGRGKETRGIAASAGCRGRGRSVMAPLERSKRGRRSAFYIRSAEADERPTGTRFTPDRRQVVRRGDGWGVRVG